MLTMSDMEEGGRGAKMAKKVLTYFLDGSIGKLHGVASHLTLIFSTVKVF